MTHAEHLADYVRQLLDEVTVRVEWTEYRKGAHGRRPEQRIVTRRDPGLLPQLGATTGRSRHAWLVEDLLTTVPTTIPGKPARVIRTGHKSTTTTHQAASFAEVGAATPSGSPGWDADGALSATRGGGYGSREPVTPALLLADQIASEVAQVYTHLYSRVFQLTVGSGRVSVGGRLHHMVALVAQTEDDDLARWALGRVRTWVVAARTLLGYDARVIELVSWSCPECGGRLRTRADDESLVWCAGLGSVIGPREHMEDPMPVSYPGCGATWSKLGWVDLMTRAGRKAAQ
uniref:hypothetical protein n=1 Tax=Herbidospora sakaeratensis TaxID=564415 RepID=UPI0007810A9C|nr:hypothetical protein [Herbidospora sakaeratensis]